MVEAMVGLGRGTDGVLVKGFSQRDLDFYA
jgi:hypothetical protein